jgi:3-phenylpropionate/cinnamic acid dioxygenase small subunit
LGFGYARDAELIDSGVSLRERVAAFYAYETTLLDDNRLREWFDLCDDAIRYVMPMRETRLGPPSENPNPPFYLYNDDKASLETRISRLETGMALVESPPAASQRLVTDVHVLRSENSIVEARSSFIVVQVRDERNEVQFTGRRTDCLRIVDDGFRILRRDILLVHYVLSRTISVFF